MSGVDNLIPVKPGEIRNPAGRPKGSVNLSAHIQNMLNDPDFTATIIQKDGKSTEFKGAPIKAIIRTAILKSMSGDKQWAEWLAKHGYGVKQVHEFEGDAVDAILAQYMLSNKDILSDLKEEKVARQDTEAKS
jgi:hypothetical protein